MDMPGLNDLEAIARRMACDFPISRFGAYTQPILFPFGEYHCPDEGWPINGSGHIHRRGNYVLIHLTREALEDLLSESPKQDPVDVMAWVWATARKPFYRPESGKAVRLRAKIAETYRVRLP